jgi:hypothetical protein
MEKNAMNGRKRQENIENGQLERKLNQSSLSRFSSLMGEEKQFESLERIYVGSFLQVDFYVELSLNQIPN